MQPTAPKKRNDYEKKLRIVPYLWRTRKTTVSQLARVMGMGRDEIEKILGIQMK